MTDINQKELIWVRKDFAERYNKLESDEERYKIFEEFLAEISESSKREFKANLESLEEDVVIYTGLMLKVKQAFRAAKEEALASSYALWEEYEKEIPKVSEKVKNVTDKLTPITDAVRELSASLNGIPIYQVDQLVDLVKRISTLDKQSRSLIEQVIMNSKEKK